MTTSDPFASIQRFLYTRPEVDVAGSAGGESCVIIKVRGAPRDSEAMTLQKKGSEKDGSAALREP